MDENNFNYHSLPNDIALELIKQWIKPDNTPLGIPFGWIQPGLDSNVTLGDLYIQFAGEYTIADLITNEIRLGFYQYKSELAVSLNTAKMVIRLARELGIKDLRLDKINFNGIYSSENPSCEFLELEPNDQCLYHLAILCLNTMTEGHNLAIEFLDYLADYYIPKGSICWSLYDGDCYELGEIVELITYESNFPFSFYDNDRYYDVEGSLNLNPKILDWINELEYKFQEDPTELDLIQYIFDKEIPWDYQREEILYYLAWIIDWLKEEFKSNNLKFSNQGLEGLNPKLRSWIIYVTSQLTF